MPKLTQPQQIMFLGFLLLGGLVFAFIQFPLKQKNAEIVRLRATLEEKRKDLEEAKKIVAKYAEFKKRADSVQRELEWIQNRLPKAIEKTRMLEAVGFVQNRSGVYLTNVTFIGKPNTKDTYLEVPVKVAFSTNFQGLLNFLYQVSNSALFMTMDSLIVNSSTVPDNPNTTLSVQIFVNGVQAK